MSGQGELVRAPFRLAIRGEGEMVNAYCAPLETMDGATLLGSIKRSIVGHNRERFEQWRDLMQECLGDAVEAVIGCRPEFPTIEPAPEHEKSGRA